MIVVMATEGERSAGAAGKSRFSAELMHAVARLYYLEDATQADIAARLGVSRPTVSRLLSEARRAGIARIEVVDPATDAVDELARDVELALRLDRVHLAGASAGPVGETLAPGLSRALQQAGLRAGDVLLVSSGRTVYEASNASLPTIPGLVLVPTIGGQDEPEVWYAPNEITRRMAERLGGTPTPLHAPALPSPGLHDALLDDPGFRRVTELWSTARCAVLGIGAPPAVRASLPRFVPRDAPSLRRATGDVCSRFYDDDGEPVPWPGSTRLVATPLDLLRRTPTSIGVAAGAPKVPAIRAAAKAGYITQLVTDTATATALVAAPAG